MPTTLTPEQQQELDAPAQPARLIDPRTNTSYVLLPEAEYEAFREAVEDERRQREVRAVGLRNAGRRIGEP
ncbi:MAG: hypothetical protein ACRC33_02700 [Gemmataceae bacterium]